MYDLTTFAATRRLLYAEIYAFHGFSSHLPRSSSFKISGTTACSSLKLVAIMRVFNKKLQNFVKVDVDDDRSGTAHPL